MLTFFGTQIMGTVNPKPHSIHPSENFRVFFLSFQEKNAFKLILWVFSMSRKTPVRKSFTHSKAPYYVIVYLKSKGKFWKIFEVVKACFFQQSWLAVSCGNQTVLRDGNIVHKLCQKYGIVGDRNDNLKLVS